MTWTGFDLSVLATWKQLVHTYTSNLPANVGEVAEWTALQVEMNGKQSATFLPPQLFIEHRSVCR